jgi:protoheme ferro-lyase
MRLNTISNHTAEGERQVEEIRAEEYGVPVTFTGPLWDSNALHQMFVDKVNAAVGDADRSKIGILLVGHGQPDEWDREFPTETEHEIQFRQAILKLLEQEGYHPENIGQAWMEFKEPEPAEKVEELVGKGVETVLYFAVAISADSLHSQYDIPALVGEAKLPPEVSVINLGAWNDRPRTIQAIKELIEVHMPK